MLFQEPQPHRCLLLGAEVQAVSEATQGGGPGSGGQPTADDSGRQVTEQVPQDVHGVLISNGVALKLTSGAGGKAQCAKSLQSCPTLCDHTDGSPPGSPVPGILQARTLEWVAISFSNA